MLDGAGEIARWYLVTALIGAGGLLPATLLFDRLDSRGVLYGKPFGLLVTGYVAWIAGWGLPTGYSDAAAWLGVAVLGGWSGALAWRQPRRLALIRGQWRLLLLGEALFAVIFTAVTFARSQEPSATYTEKPMDMMILVALREAETLPPRDSWYAGHTLSYYHLGHTMVDVTSRLAGVAPGVAFNLGLAGAGAMAGTAMFGLAGDASALTAGARRRTWLAGGVATGVLLLLGSLEGGVELLAANGIGGTGWARLGVSGFPSGAEAVNGVPAEFWWWWRATRVLPDAISEFPAFSFVLGDLHAHVLALPLAILAVAIALTAFAGSRPQTLRVWWRHPGALASTALVFSALVMTNAWDAPLYGLVWLAAGVAVYRSAGWRLFDALVGMGRHLLPPAVLAGLLAWPMLRGLESVPVGLSPVLTSGSDPARLLLVWGPLVALLAACALVVRPVVHRGVARAVLVCCGSAVLAWALACAVSGNASALATRGAGWVTLVAVALVIAYTLGAAAAEEGARQPAHAAWLGLTGLAAAIVFGTELFHLVDASMGRYNTVFKFWYGAWVLLAAASGVAVADALAVGRARGAGAVTRGVALAAVLLVELCTLYTPAVVLSRGREGESRGLDALAFLDARYPDEAAVVRWAREILPPDAVLVEAAGQSFQATSRVSMASGRATIVGWPGHEVTWRGDSEAVAARMDDVNRLYNSGPGPEGVDVVRRYGVTHVLIGPRERELYGFTVAARFEGWHTVFEAGDLRVIEVPEGLTRP